MLRVKVRRPAYSAQNGVWTDTILIWRRTLYWLQQLKCCIRWGRTWAVGCRCWERSPLPSLKSMHAYSDTSSIQCSTMCG